MCGGGGGCECLLLFCWFVCLLVCFVLVRLFLLFVWGGSVSLFVCVCGVGGGRGGGGDSLINDYKTHFKSRVNPFSSIVLEIDTQVKDEINVPIALRNGHSATILP